MDLFPRAESPRGGSSRGCLSPEPFTTADLCDAYAGEVQVAQPIFRDFGGLQAFAGPAETVRVADDNSLVGRILETGGRGRVLVVDGGGSLRCALVGGRLAALATERGWRGIVINGCIRDSAEVAGTPLGVKALAACPMRSAKNGSGEQGVTVSFAGVIWKPGEIVYADQDGIVLAQRPLVALSP